MMNIGHFNGICSFILMPGISFVELGEFGRLDGPGREREKRWDKGNVLLEKIG
jgi:hypothetical protein